MSGIFCPGPSTATWTSIYELQRPCVSLQSSEQLEIDYLRGEVTYQKSLGCCRAGRVKGLEKYGDWRHPGSVEEYMQRFGLSHLCRHGLGRPAS